MDRSTAAPDVTPVVGATPVLDAAPGPGAGSDPDGRPVLDVTSGPDATPAIDKTAGPAIAPAIDKTAGPVIAPVADLAPQPAKCCPADHPNDPDADRCWICGDPFDPAAALITRVPGAVARLLFEDGTAVEVADDLMIGRCPSADDRRATLTVSGRQVSRQHLVLEIRGWRLYATDWGSTNGTFITRRGARGRRRVPADDAVPLRIGDSLHFGSRQALLARPTAG
ncbi:MAG: FHA domain-containing protein [Actinomycetota bacterium]